MLANPRPLKFLQWSAHFEIWQKWVCQNRIFFLEGCLAFILKYEFVDKVVLGLDTEEQLNEILSCSPPTKLQFPNELFISDELLIDPFNWTKL